MEGDDPHTTHGRGLASITDLLRLRAGFRQSRTLAVTSMAWVLKSWLKLDRKLQFLSFFRVVLSNVTVRTLSTSAWFVTGAHRV